MKKTISITLNGLVFNIEEDAYERLYSYLDRLKQHFGSAEYGKEVVNDIESRIAEQFIGQLKDRKKEAIIIAEVEEVIKTMGSVEDLTGETKKSDHSSNEPHSKRLYRNPDDQIIAGVASGIASYFDIDPVITRILFVAITLAGGSGILIYLILWIVVPEAQTSAEKLEMKGDPVTVANLEQSHKENLERKKNFSMFRYFFRELFYLIRRFLRSLVPILATIAGLIITAMSFVSIFAFTLLMMVLLFNPNSTYIDPAVAQVFNGSRYIMLIISGFLALIIPTLTTLLLGISLVRRRNVFTTTLTGLFTVIWLAGALTFGFMAIDSAPQVQAAVKSIEERPNQSREFQATGFDSIETGRDHRVKIIYGTTPRVVAYGEENKLKRVNMEVVDNALVISQREDDFRICLFCISRPVTIEITTPNLAAVDANSMSKVEIQGFNNLENLVMDAHGASEIKFNGRIKNINLDLGSAAKIELIGSGEKLIAELTNASRLEAENFIANSANIEVFNSSRADIRVINEVTIMASGASRVEYSGNPSTTNIQEQGAASITPK